MNIFRSRAPACADTDFATAASAPSPYTWRHPPSVLAGCALLGLASGSAVALGGLNGLFLCLSLTGACLILFDFRIGVVLLIVLMPISGSYLFPHQMFGLTGLNPLNLLLIATLGSCLLRMLSDGTAGNFAPGPLLWLYIAPTVLAAALGSRHVAQIVPAFYDYEMINFTDTAGYLRDMLVKPLLLVVFALLVAAAAARSRRPALFLVPMAISTWVMSLVVIAFVVLTGGQLADLARSTSREFLSALGMHANELGRLYAVAYAILLFAWSESRDPVSKLGLLASIGVVMLALLLTFSRGAFAAVVLVTLFYVLWRRNWKALMFLAVFTAVAALAFPDAIYDRVTFGFDQGLDAITAGRLEGLWLPLLPEVLHNPVFGAGLGSTLWSEAMQRGGGSTVLGVTHPHNAYLQALLDMGIVGLALLCAYFVHVWRGLVSLSRAHAIDPTLRGSLAGAAAGLLGFLIAALADGALTPRPEQVYLWFAIGLMYGLRSAGQALPRSPHGAAPARGAP